MSGGKSWGFYIFLCSCNFLFIVSQPIIRFLYFLKLSEVHIVVGYHSGPKPQHNWSSLSLQTKLSRDMSTWQPPKLWQNTWLSRYVG